MYTLKSIAQRGTLLGAAAALVVAAVLPSAAVFADSLNPLTDRSLTLSSSSPGWDYKDGSGNTDYAPPNSGTNGKQTGNTFAFKVSSDSTSTPIQAMSLQYCVTPAGDCTAPGNDATGGGTAGVDTATTSDLNVHFPTPAELSSGDFSTIVGTDGNVKAVPGYAGYSDGKPGGSTGIGGAGAAVNANFSVFYLDQSDSTWKPSTGWTLTPSSKTAVASPTTANNYITLTNATGLSIAPATQVKVVFFGTTDNYITNPGAGSFFVRMNTYNNVDAAVGHIIDGGVTVANVMNQSIWIQTKVLETMDFSVGTVDPMTLSSADGSAVAGSEAPSTLEKAIYADATTHTPALTGTTKHAPCGAILGNITPDQPANVLKLGDQTSESSLRTDTTYSTHSYWRLSSNSSAGATVYYSGHTLTNTVGDEIKPIGAAKTAPQQGAEQFGLALDNNANSGAPGTSISDLKVSYGQEGTSENGNDTGHAALDASTTTDLTSNGSYHEPTLYPLQPTTNYNQGTGAINGTPDTKFAFLETSDTTPVPLASENNQVVDCVTGKMRYIANIAATTPAGIYTTKVNYIASPQY